MHSLTCHFARSIRSTYHSVPSQRRPPRQPWLLLSLSEPVVVLEGTQVVRFAAPLRLPARPIRYRRLALAVYAVPQALLGSEAVAKGWAAPLGAQPSTLKEPDQMVLGRCEYVGEAALNLLELLPVGRAAPGGAEAAAAAGDVGGSAAVERPLYAHRLRCGEGRLQRKLCAPTAGVMIHCVAERVDAATLNAGNEVRMKVRHGVNLQKSGPTTFSRRQPVAAKADFPDGMKVSRVEVKNRISQHAELTRCDTMP